MEPWRHMLMTFFYGLCEHPPLVRRGDGGGGRGLAHAVRAGADPLPPGIASTAQALSPELEDAIAALRNDSMEVLERLDFLERALAQRDLPPGAPKPALPPAPRSMDTPSGRVRTPV